MNANKVFEKLKNDAVAIYSEESLKQKLLSGKKLKIKLGADPSRPDLHLGHSVVLRKLRLLQDLGHEIIFVIGDFTGMIGDPSGKSKTRVPLTFEQTRINGQSYYEQVTKILDKDKTKITYNSQWLAKMNFADVLQLAGKYTLAQILERDDFAKRYSDNQPIGLHEIFYPLMQGYDSVALNADIEVGGTDQTFNLLVGRQLQKDYSQPSQDVITFPLLIGLDGTQKMSKSLDNYIGLTEPADIMFEKCMKVPDNCLLEYFKFTTDISDEKYSNLIVNDIRAAHFLYANEIVKMYHSEDMATLAERRYKEVSSGSTPNNIKTIEIIKSEILLIDALIVTQFAASKSEARRLIKGGGIKLNGNTTTDIETIIKLENDVIISKGKASFAKLCYKANSAIAL